MPGRRSDGANFTVDTFARYLLHDPDTGVSLHYLSNLLLPPPGSTPLPGVELVASAVVVENCERRRCRRRWPSDLSAKVELRDFNHGRERDR